MPILIVVFFSSQNAARSLNDGNRNYYLECQQKLNALNSVFPNGLQKVFESDKWKERKQLFEESVSKGENAKKDPGHGSKPSVNDCEKK